jgi:hypothetical protein
VTVTRGGSWVIFVAVLLVIAAWPPQEGRSLASKALNWAVDPTDSLPMLPEQLGFGVSDDPIAVEARDAEVRRYDDLYNRSALSRLRLRLKVAGDPFEPTTERQVLLVVGVTIAFAALRFGARRT